MKSPLPDDFEVTPAAGYYTHSRNGLVTVHISNTTTKTLNFSSKAILYELQRIKIDLNLKVTATKESIDPLLDTVSIQTLGLSKVEVDNVKHLMEKKILLVYTIFPYMPGFISNFCCGKRRN